MAGFEPESFALEANILAKLYYIPLKLLVKVLSKKDAYGIISIEEIFGL